MVKALFFYFFLFFILFIFLAGGDQGNKATSKLLKINQKSRMRGNLTFDPWKSSDQEPQKGTIKQSSTLFADQQNLIVIANAATDDVWVTTQVANSD